MTLPNFLVIGAMKAGTTALHQYLNAHPQVFMSRNKELHFFVEGLNRNGWDCGWEKGWRWYEEQFVGAEGAVAVGESSPSYTAYPLRQGVPARIAETLPDARLIYLLRHPIERILSEYVHKYINARERRPVADAVLEDPVYLDKSRYATQIHQYLDRFPQDQLLLVVSEALRTDRPATMVRIWDFLGVTPLPENDILSQEFHRNEDKKPVSRLGRAARRVPGYASVARRSPSAVRSAYRVLMRPHYDPRHVTLSAELRRKLQRQLAPDLECLRKLCPEALERWEL